MTIIDAASSMAVPTTASDGVPQVVITRRSATATPIL
jgi:hypothetical protein